MGKIIGNKKVSVKVFTEDEVKELTNDLNAKITELTSENIKIKDEFDAKDEVIENLNAKITELTSENEVLKKDKAKKGKAEE